MKKFILFVIFWLIIFYLVLKFLVFRPEPEDFQGGYDRAVVNYKEEVDIQAQRFNLPSSYLMAVIMLECSGRKNVPPRFEEDIYEQLVNIRDKKASKLENVTYSIIHDATDDALKNLASSWGPFQLMGYKCTLLDISLEELRGPDGIYWSIRWIDLTYGDYLRKKKFKDAFHIHNAGKEFPKNGIPFTHDPKYVERGLKYMKYFERLDSMKGNNNNPVKIYW